MRALQELLLLLLLLLGTPPLSSSSRAITYRIRWRCVLWAWVVGGEEMRKGRDGKEEGRHGILFLCVSPLSSSSVPCVEWVAD